MDLCYIIEEWIGTGIETFVYELLIENCVKNKIKSIGGWNPLFSAIK